MAVQDLWVGRDGQPTDRHGRGRRYRVVVSGHPTRSFATKRPAEMYEAKLLVEGPARARLNATVGDLVDAWLLTKQPSPLVAGVRYETGTVADSAGRLP